MGRGGARGIASRAVPHAHVEVGPRHAQREIELPPITSEILVELRTQEIEHRRLAWPQLAPDGPLDALELRLEHPPSLELEHEEVRVSRSGDHLADRRVDAGGEGPGPVSLRPRGDYCHRPNQPRSRERPKAM